MMDTFARRLKRSYYALLSSILICCASIPMIHAEELTLLRVENGNKVIALSRSDLEQLPQNSFTTTTIWTEGKIAFSGPSLKDVLATVGLDGQSVEAVAINDYKALIPAKLIGDRFPIVATRRNGEAFGRREKGPLWIVFPFDRSEEFQRELVFSSSVWQVIELHAVKD